MRYVMISVQESNKEPDDKIKLYLKTTIDFYGLKNILDSNSIVIKIEDTK